MQNPTTPNQVQPEIDPDSVEYDEIEPEPAKEEPNFKVGDICILRESVNREYGTIPKDQVVEIKRRFPKNKRLHYDVETLPCDSCGLIINAKDIGIELLQDYDEVFPPTY